MAFYHDKIYNFLLSMRVLATLVLCVMAALVYGQELKTENIIVITLDGYRWQEFFKGADPRIINDPKYVNDTGVMSAFGTGSPEEKREKLMPFMWNVVAKQGQLYGNRTYNNKVNCTNFYLISYPGYSEMFVGFPGHISSNKEKVNPNPTVFEYISKQPGYNNEVVAFTTWDAFPFILREKKSGIYVNAGKESAVGNLSAREKAINKTLSELKTDDHRSDQQTFDLAFEYLKKEKPRVLFVGFDGTDFHGHGGRYDEYLKSAADADRMIESLWNWTQAQPEYKGKTTFFITTDHGRGMGKNTWKNHRLVAPGSRHIWFAVLGPDTPAFGELKFKGKYYQKQVAKTLAAFLGMQFQPRRNSGEVIQTMIAAPVPVAEEIILGKTSKSAGN
jgi:hypothetical protein